MKLVTLITLLLLFLCLHSASQKLHYPQTPKLPVTDTLFGRVIVDNYRWLENVHSPQVQQWLRQQANLTNEILSKIPGRNKLLEAYKEMDRLATADLSLFIIREAGRYFYKKANAGENVKKLYFREGKQGKETLLFDPVSDSVGFNFVPSKDGKKVALSFWAHGNFDITTVKVLDVDTRKFYPDRLYPVGAIQGWLPDSRGFLYAALQTNDKASTTLWKDMAIKYHELNTDQKSDKTIFSRITHSELALEPTDFLSVSYYTDNKYLIAVAWKGAQDQNNFFYSVASDSSGLPVEWKVLATMADQIREAYIYKGKIYAVSHKNAPNYNVLVSPLDSLDLTNAKVLVPETNLPIGWVKMSKDFFFVQKTEGIVTQWVQYNVVTGKKQTVNVPYTGSVWIYCPDASTNECIINLLSWTKPLTRYEYDPFSQKTSLSVFHIPSNLPGIDELTAEEVEVKSHDGTMVPLSLIYNKRTKKDGNNIAFMTGYGAYGSGHVQSFNPLFFLC